MIIFNSSLMTPEKASKTFKTFLRPPPPYNRSGTLVLDGDSIYMIYYISKIEGIWKRLWLFIEYPPPI